MLISLEGGKKKEHQKSKQFNSYGMVIKEKSNFDSN